MNARRVPFEARRSGGGYAPWEASARAGPVPYPVQGLHAEVPVFVRPGRDGGRAHRGGNSSLALCLERVGLSGWDTEGMWPIRLSQQSKEMIVRDCVKEHRNY